MHGGDGTPFLVAGQCQGGRAISRHIACLTFDLDAMSGWVARGMTTPTPISRGEFGIVAARALEDKILELGADNVAAFIGEPVQGAGGVIDPPETYWPEIQRICRKYDILLVADEVICGFGRTGQWFGSQTYDIEPDLMPMAKGLSSGYLPISAVAMNGRVFEVVNEGGLLAHGYTYSGHPVACAVALENIRIMKDEKLVERAREIAPYLKTAIAGLADHPLVGEVRSMGLIGAFELVRNKATRERFEPVSRVGLLCRDHCFRNGLIMRACWDTMVFAPPLVPPLVPPVFDPE